MNKRKKTTINVKEWLLRYRDAKNETRRIIDEYNEMVQIQEMASAIKYSDMPKASNYERDLSNLMVSRDEKLTQFILANRKMDTIFREISDMVMTLERQREKDVIDMRYLNMNGYKLKTWDEISRIMHMEKSGVLKIHGVALRKIGERLEKFPPFSS